MFSNERSDFAVPVIGFLLAAVMMITLGISYFNMEWKFFDTPGSEVTFMIIISALLLLFGVLSLWKAYIVDGVTLLLLGVVGIVMGHSMGMNLMPPVCIALAIAFLLTAFMSYRVGDYTILAFDVLSALFVILMIPTDMKLFIVFGIVTTVAGLIALYASAMDWMLVQDIASDFADEMYGDDDCCCDDDCDCGCHDEESEE